MDALISYSYLLACYNLSRVQSLGRVDSAESYPEGWSTRRDRDTVHHLADFERDRPWMGPDSADSGPIQTDSGLPRCRRSSSFTLIVVWICSPSCRSGSARPHRSSSPVWIRYARSGSALRVFPLPPSSLSSVALVVVFCRRLLPDLS